MGNNAPARSIPSSAIRLVYGGELTPVFAAVVIGVIPSLLYLGPLSDRAGRRPLLVVALAHAVAGALAFTQPGQVQIAAAGRLLSP